ncbi:MAG: hypothetical protein JWN70_1734 [Planctomycetaceae bacterium]|nr:hypothetical protein [Planctomycetaceae bacterium]
MRLIAIQAGGTNKVCQQAIVENIRCEYHPGSMTLCLPQPTHAVFYILLEWLSTELSTI